MNCKFCNAPLPEDSAICPACGRDNEAAEVAPIQQETAPEEETPVTEEETPEVEETPEPEEKTPEVGSPDSAPVKQGMSGGKIALVAVIAIIAVAIIAALAVACYNAGRNNPNPPAVGTDTTGPATTDPTELTIPSDGNPDDVTCKGSYTVSDDALIAARDTVVATAGDATLTVGQLQIYYWQAFYEFMNQYGAYAAYFGLDITQPLDKQPCTMAENQTWQQFFLAQALSDWHRYQSLSLEAQNHSFTLSAEYQTYLDGLEQKLDESAVTYGYENGAAMLKADMGAGAEVKDYVNYIYLTYLGYEYFSSEFNGKTPTEEEILAYFTEHEADYLEKQITKDSGVYVDVRHILLSPEGGTTSEDGKTTTYSDAEWEACRTAAQQILDDWLAGEHTEDSFAALANEKSTDPGSNTKGGLYEDVYAGQMVAEFNDWCFDGSRQVGDYGLVKTSYGYHIMYFVGSEPIWHATASQDMMADAATKLVEDAIAKHPLTVDYSKIALGYVDQASAS